MAPGAATTAKHPTSPDRRRSVRARNAARAVFELPQAYVCEKAVGPGKTCDFRSGRVILQRPVERAQMAKLLATERPTCCSSCRRARDVRSRPSWCARATARSDSNSRRATRPRPRVRGARGARQRSRSWARIRTTESPVELHAGRYGPYVKHGEVNATLPDRERIDALTLAQALALLAARVARTGAAPPPDAHAARPSAQARRSPEGRRTRAWLRARRQDYAARNPRPRSPRNADDQAANESETARGGEDDFARQGETRHAAHDVQAQVVRRTGLASFTPPPAACRCRSESPARAEVRGSR